MRTIGLIARSIIHYRRMHFTAALAVIAAAAVLSGSLGVGQRINRGLAWQTQIRLGRITAVVECPGTLFGAALADGMEQSGLTVSPIILNRGFAENAQGDIRVPGIQIVGVDDRFWSMGPANNKKTISLSEGKIAVSRTLADLLKISPGDEIVVRMNRLGGLSADNALVSDKQRWASFRKTADVIIEDSQFGGFDLQIRPDGGLNVFMDIRQMNVLLEQSQDRPAANAILIAGSPAPDAVSSALRKSLAFSDFGLESRILPELGVIEIRSRDIFIRDPLAKAVRSAGVGGWGVMTYFVNELKSSAAAVPYSMAAAIELSEGVFAGLADDQVIVNEWLADQLGVDEQDKIEMRYFVLGADSQLTEQTAAFRVKTVIPMMGIGADASLMPEYESLSNADSCSQWEPGIPVDLSKIRPADELYWDTYRGTPKAFISAKTAAMLWGNRYGEWTSIRFPLMQNTQEAIEQQTVNHLLPTLGGFQIVNLQKTASVSALASTDFGSLAFGLSLFLIAASLILAMMIYTFAMERRAGQLAVLSAVGFSRASAFRIVWLEDIAAAAPACILGAYLGPLYSQLLLSRLSSIYALPDAAQPVSVFDSTALLSAAITLLTIGLTLRFRLAAVYRRCLAELLSGDQAGTAAGRHSRWPLPVGLACIFAAVVFSVLGVFVSAQTAQGLFFGGGVAALAGMGLLCRWALSFLAARQVNPVASAAALAARFTALRKGRSLAVILILAMGVFSVLSTSLYMPSPVADETRIDGPTGGFSLWAQADIPIVRDLNSPQVQASLNLEKTQTRFNAVAVREYTAQQASCLNPGRVDKPTLWGIRPDQMAGRFTVAGEGWEAMDAELGDDVVPAIGDYATVYWQLHKNLGKDLEYIDQQGRLFRVRIVGMTHGSILQGGLWISQRQFVKRFGAVSGSRVMLIQTAAQDTDVVAAGLTRALRDYGFSAVRTGWRLGRFQQVEAIYITIFMLLGSLGLILGCIGLGLVAMLNIQERAGHLAMLRAMGFSRRRLGWMLFGEHTLLAIAGVAVGAIAAMTAAGPSLFVSGRFPYAFAAGLAAAMLANAIIWIAAAIYLGLRGNLIDALRKE